VPVIFEKVVTGGAIGLDVWSSLLEASADWELPEGKLNYKLVFWDAESADGREGGSPVYLLEGFITPVVLIQKVRAESGPSRSVEQGLADLARGALAADSNICVAVWIV
jgi:hypothetical protein